MPQASYAHHFLSIPVRLLKEPGTLFALIVVVAGILARQWSKLRFLLTSSVARNWPTVSAAIDVVSVAERLADDKTTEYVATLSYFYRNPELQMGEYERVFHLKSVASTWAEQFKGRQALVHVNPERPEESVLLKSDVAAMTLRPDLSTEDAIWMEKLPLLPARYRLLAVIAELVSLAGLAASAVLLGSSIATGGRAVPAWTYWTGGAMFAFTAAATWLIELRTSDKGSFESFLKNFRLWCPAWMRWGLSLSGTIVCIVWFLSVIRADLPEEVEHWLVGTAPHLPYIWGCWGFLGSAAFHAALLRSQEDAGPVEANP
jgi:hypothetical protein